MIESSLSWHISLVIFYCLRDRVGFNRYFGFILAEKSVDKSLLLILVISTTLVSLTSNDGLLRHCVGDRSFSRVKSAIILDLLLAHIDCFIMHE